MAKKYFIGTSGWNYRHWKKRFYPEDLSQKQWFDYYAENFSTVEVNYSFYKWPSKKTMQKWHDESPGDFRYTMKAPRTITHIKRLHNVERQVRDFYKLTSLLKRKAGCHLFQLPPSFRSDERNTARLRKLVELLDARKDNCIEFRHKSWWNEETYHLLKDNGIAFCTVSGLGMPKERPPLGKLAYYRFHGTRYSTDYTASEIREYARSMKNLKSSKAYAYFNNDARAYAVHNAEQLKELVE